MESRQSVALIPGKGIEGDRYALRKGTYSARFMYEPGRHLTMVSADGIIKAIKRTGLEPFDMEALRRNVVLRGISARAVNDMVGHEVRIGEHCRVFVHRQTVPCKYREAACGRSGMRNKLWDACGVSCEILSPIIAENDNAGGTSASERGLGGVIRVGDGVVVIPNTYKLERINVGIKPHGFFIRPANLTLEDVKKMITPPHMAALAAVWDPEGFQQVEESYNKFGQTFWSPRAYGVGSLVKRFRILLLAALTTMFCIIVVLSLSSDINIDMTRDNAGAAKELVMKHHEV